MEIFPATVRRAPFRAAVVVVVAALLIWAVATVVRFAGESDAVAASRRRIFVCSETGQPFEYLLQRGDRIPIHSPHSGKLTGYPAELCFWTPDGGEKSTPTAVLLNATLGLDGPTFCPDCDRLVVGFNPRPAPGVMPPPTSEQLKRAGGGRDD